MSFTETLSGLFENAKGYVSLQVEYYRLGFYEKVVGLLTHLIASVVFMVIGLLFLFFASLAAGYALGEKLNNLPLGFLIIAAGYFVVFLLCIIFRKQLIISPVSKGIIRILMKNNPGHNGAA